MLLIFTNKSIRQKYQIKIIYMCVETPPNLPLNKQFQNLFELLYIIIKLLSNTSNIIHNYIKKIYFSKKQKIK